MKYEVIEETFAGHIISSTLRDPTIEEINELKKEYEEGKCSHKLIEDKPGWLYDLRYCYICKTFLGFI